MYYCNYVNMQYKCKYVMKNLFGYLPICLIIYFDIKLYFYLTVQKVVLLNRNIILSDELYTHC